MHQKAADIVDVDGDDLGALTARVLWSPEHNDRIFLEAQDVFSGPTPFTPGWSLGSITAEHLCLSSKRDGPLDLVYHDCI